MANVYAQLEPIKGLRIKTNFGYQLSASTSRSFIPVYKLASNTFTTENLVSQGSSTGTSLLWENTVNYNTKLGKHSIDALLGQSIEKSGMGESINGSNYNSIFSDFKHAYLDNTPVVTGRTQLSGRHGATASWPHSSDASTTTTMANTWHRPYSAPTDRPTSQAATAGAISRRCRQDG